MTTNAQARTRLTELMDKRRGTLRLQWSEVATEAGMSAAHLRRIRHNEVPLTSLMIGGLEKALHWAPGSIDRVLQGGDPIEASSVNVTAPAGVIRQGAAPRNDERHVPADGVRAAIRALAETLPPDEVRAILAEFRASETDPTYADPVEQHLWETPGLGPSQRRQLIYHLQAMRRAEEAPERERPQADVREFRPRR